MAVREISVILARVPTEEEFDRWFVLGSADAVASRSFSTEEIVAAHGRGALKDRTVVYHRFGSRRDSLTVKELVERSRAKE